MYRIAGLMNRLFGAPTYLVPQVAGRPVRTYGRVTAEQITASVR